MDEHFFWARYPFGYYCYSQCCVLCNLRFSLGFPGGSVVKNPSANAGDLVLIPELRRSSGEGNGNPLQYSCLGNPLSREAWKATGHGDAKESDTN